MYAGKTAEKHAGACGKSRGRVQDMTYVVMGMALSQGNVGHVTDNAGSGLLSQLIPEAVTFGC